MKRCMVVLSCVVVLSSAGRATACDLCAVYLAGEARESRPGWFVGVAEQYSHFRDWREDGERVPNEDGEFLDSLITQGVVGYRFNRRVGVQINVPVICREYRRVVEHGLERGRESGVGDVSVMARCRVAEKVGQETMAVLDVFAGLKLPTGDSDRLAEEAEHEEGQHEHPSGVHGHDLALGSGSVDGIVGVAALAEWRRLFVAGQVQYVIRTEGDFDYRYAHDLLWSGGPGVFVWLGHGGSLAVQVVVSGEWKEKDELSGEKVDDTGLTAVYIGPAVLLTVGERFNAEFAVDLPVMQETTGLQIVPDCRVRAGVTWRL